MIIEMNEAYRSLVVRDVEEEWAGPLVVTRGQVYDTRHCPGLIAVEEGKLTGYLLYRPKNEEWEILVLHALEKNRGIGTALIDALAEKMKAAGGKRLSVVTTNDNIPAILFYQRRGFSLGEVGFNALEETRKIKPNVPEIGLEGIRLSHELVFFRSL